MDNIKTKLSIIIATYNRSEYLKRTLRQLADSPVRDCRITILNNHSTDNTLSVCDEYANNFQNFTVVTHPANLGGGSQNYIHAIEYCDTEYMWLLADDDTFDFSSFSDVELAIGSENFDIIQLGAHNDCSWNWGYEDTPKSLISKGYKYFLYSSFLPGTIFRYKYFIQYMKDAYFFLHYSYPHMPCLIYAYKNDIPIYLSKYRIVTALIGNQSYDLFIPFVGFVMLSNMLESKKEKRMMIYSNQSNFAYQYLRIVYCHFKDNIDNKYIFKIAFIALPFVDQLVVIIGFIPFLIASKLNILSILRKLRANL